MDGQGYWSYCCGEDFVVIEHQVSGLIDLGKSEGDASILSERLSSGCIYCFVYSHSVSLILTLDLMYACMPVRMS